MQLYISHNTTENNEFDRLDFVWGKSPVFFSFCSFFLSCVKFSAWNEIVSTACMLRMSCMGCNGIGYCFQFSRCCQKCSEYIFPVRSRALVTRDWDRCRLKPFESRLIHINIPRLLLAYLTVRAMRDSVLLWLVGNIFTCIKFRVHLGWIYQM